jgi:hypothetical protein
MAQFIKMLLFQKKRILSIEWFMLLRKNENAFWEKQHLKRMKRRFYASENEIVYGNENVHERFMLL